MDGGRAGRGGGWLLEPAVDGGPDTVRGRVGEALGSELGCGPVCAGMRACGVGDHRVASRRGQGIGVLPRGMRGSGVVEVGGAGTLGASGYVLVAPGAGEPGDHLGGQAGRCLQGCGQFVGAEP